MTRPCVPAAGPHGGDVTRVAAALGVDPTSIIDLSASMNPYAPDVGALFTADRRRLDDALHRYPDPAVGTAALAAAIDVDPDVVVLTNGGAEAIALVAAEIRIGNVVEPEFSLYRRHLAVIDESAPRWRSNPSNPMGQLAEPHDVAGVWDEAFYPLATGSWTRGDSEAWRLGSMTKLWNCPGLRLGYVIAPDGESALRLQRRQPQWSVNGLALDIVTDLLARTDLPGWSAQIAGLSAEFATGLRALGFDVHTTEANWVLVDRRDLRTDLAVLGVLVRECASFGLPGLHRVALPHPSRLDEVLAAFAHVQS